LLVVWKVIYLGFLVPGRILDAPLTHAVGVLTVSGLNLFTRSDAYWSKNEPGTNSDETVMQESVYFNHQKLVGIYDGCNALELFVLYAGFIVCMPASAKRKLIFAVSGVALIFLVNILRCMVVAYIVQYYPQNADFVHHYVFVFIVYALIISLWLFFTGKLNIKAYADQQP
jgi:exosortase family protein XrtF